MCTFHLLVISNHFITIWAVQFRHCIIVKVSKRYLRFPRALASLTANRPFTTLHCNVIVDVSSVQRCSQKLFIAEIQMTC